MKQRSFFCSGIAVAVAALSVAAAVTCQTASRAPARPNQAEAAAGLDAAVNAMYNAEYTAAEAILRRWLRDRPGDIRALNYLAEAVLDQEMLREGLYTGAAYLNSGKAFRKRDQPLPAAFVAELTRLLDRAESIEQQRLAANPRDTQALYWLGVSDSTKTEYEFALERSYFAALREGKQAWKINRRLLKIDPNFADADLVIGLADYTAGVLPWYFKVVASIAGIHGNRSKGIEELKRASVEGRYARVDAKIVLVAVYEREKQLPQALALLRELQSEYPLNYLAPLEIARIDKIEGDWRRAAIVYDETVEKFVRADPVRSNVPRALILLRAGQAHEHLGELATALTLYHEAGSMTGEQAEIYEAEFGAARLDQRLRHAAEARREYERVADAVPDSELGKEARQSLHDMK